MSELSEQERDELPESAFAFPRARKEPLVDAEHVRDAVARFDQVEGVSNRERDRAWDHIQQAARRHGVELHERDWRDLYRRNDRPIPRD